MTPRFSTEWERLDYEREQRGEKALGPTQAPAPKDATVEPDFATLEGCAVELLRLYDWRKEVGALITDSDARRYGKEKAAAWVTLRAILAGRQAAPQQEGGPDFGSPAGDLNMAAGDVLSWWEAARPFMDSVCVIAHIHGAPYAGPSGEGPMNALKSARQTVHARIAALEAALRECAMLYPLKMPHEKAINYERLAREFNRRQKLAAGALTTAGAGKIGHFSILEDGPGRFVLCDDRTDDPAPVYATREEAERAARAGKGEG